MSSVWEARWQTLETLLTALAKQYEHATQTDPWMHTMHDLIVRLKAFGKNQFQLYHNHLLQDNTHLPCRHQPKEHLMHAMLNQITHDMALFQQAIGQRRQTHLQAALYKADKLAQLAINQAVDNKFIKEIIVVTYFAKSARLRIICYAPIVLIAIPHQKISTTLFWQLAFNLNYAQMKTNYQQTNCICNTFCHS